MLVPYFNKPSLFSDFADKWFTTFDSVDFLDGKTGFPKVNIVDDGDSYKLTAEVAGWKKEDLSITFDNQILTISGTNQNSAEDTSKYIYRELKRSAFSRQFRIGNQVNRSKVTAKFENGILEVVLPKMEQSVAENKTITIL